MTDRTVGTHDLIDLKLSLDWDSEYGRHREVRYFSNYNIWRDLDLLPSALQSKILHQQRGFSGSAAIQAGELLPVHDQ